MVLELGFLESAQQTVLGKLQATLCTAPRPPKAPSPSMRSSRNLRRPLPLRSFLQVADGDGLCTEDHFDFASRCAGDWTAA